MSAEDAIREERIIMEVVVDAYGSAERAMGWYYYLADKLVFPFIAECISADKRSPLRLGDEVTVLQLSGENYCEHEIYVDMPWEGGVLAIPLAQVKSVYAEEETEEAIADWHYWKNRGYKF